MLRSFIAIRVEPTKALRRAVSQLNQMGRPVKAVDPQNLHLTLRFLGDTDPALFGSIAEAMAASCDGIGPFELEFGPVGVFPNQRRPTVVWVGVVEPAVVGRIVDQLNPRIDRLGFEPPRHPWQGHLTLARVKAQPPTALQPFLQAHSQAAFGSTHVDSIDLMTSQLRPQGPVYSLAHSVRLSSC